MRRKIVQILSMLITNINLQGFFNGKIFKGASKKLCVPGLNCYSCPGAIGSCPLGSLQAVIGSMRYNFSYYIVGTLILFGTVFGRFICGWLCPFGLVQELLYKLPTKKYKTSKFLKYFKYLVLIYFVILIPVLFTNKLGMGDPGFCKYICPSGTLFGAIPLLSTNIGLRSSVGLLFTWKMGVLIFIIVLSIYYFRFFCKVICPLGAIYGFFNSISFYKYDINHDQCIKCGLCKNTCKMDVIPYENPNDNECIRCGECIDICPQNAIYKESKSKILNVIGEYKT
jgi:polyferredoxin